MNNLVVLLVMFLVVVSCENESSFRNRLIDLYNEENVKVKIVDVVSIYASENELTKIVNLFKRQSLYSRKDSLLKLKIDLYKHGSVVNQPDSLKLKESKFKLDQNRFDQNVLNAKIKKELIQLSNFRSINNVDKLFVIQYVKNETISFSLILDAEENIEFSQDPLLK